MKDTHTIEMIIILLASLGVSALFFVPMYLLLKQRIKREQKPIEEIISPVIVQGVVTRKEVIPKRRVQKFTCELGDGSNVEGIAIPYKTMDGYALLYNAIKGGWCYNIKDDE